MNKQYFRYFVQLHFANFYSGRHIRPPRPPKQCWFLSEVHAVTEKFFVHNNAKCLRSRPTLYSGEAGCVEGVVIEVLRRL